MKTSASLCNSGRHSSYHARFAPLLCGLALLFGYSASAEPPLLRPGTNIFASGSPPSPGAHTIPCFADWNGDGKKDLIVGYQFYVALYLNCGTQSQPMFTNFTRVKAGGSDIYLPSGGCGGPAPWVCDYDNDGKRDLIVGEGNSGNVYFYRNTNTDAAPILDAGVQLPIGVGSRATPILHDWDEDGLNDILCGNGNGNVYFFKDVGTQQSPAYTSGTLLQAGGANITGSRSAIRVCDWDGDGLKDIVYTAMYNSYWFRNTNSNQSPILEAGRPIYVPKAGIGLAPLTDYYRMRLDIVDWNNDGGCDLLVGTDAGYLMLYAAYRLKFNPIPRPASNQFVLRWDSAPYLKYHLLTGPTLSNVCSCVVSNLPSGGNVTSCTNLLQGDCRFFRVLQAQ